jgi:hypothetical protein
MATARPLPEILQKWGTNAIALAEQAKVLSGVKIAQLVRKLQRQTGDNSEVIWCDPVNSCTWVGWFLFLYFEGRVSSSRGR